MASINPHVHFNGNCEEAFEFYKSVLGGEYTRLIRFKELSAMGEFVFPAEEENKIMHIALTLSNNNVLMGSDVPSVLGQVNENENRSKITIHPDSKEEADKIFEGLSVGGTVEMPIENSPWGSYFAMFRDKYGIEWMIDYVAK